MNFSCFLWWDTIIYFVWGFHGFDVSRRGLLGSDAVYCCSRIPTFQRPMLPPSSGWSGWGPLKRGILPHHYTASQPRRPGLELLKPQISHVLRLSKNSLGVTDEKHEKHNSSVGASVWCTEQGSGPTSRCSASHSVGPWYESRPVDRLSWLKIVLVFLSSSRQISENTLR